jgi:hypothetical protein
MATELQYKIFKDLYEEENARYAQLDNKSKLYVTLVTFYLGAIAFKFKDVIEFTGASVFTKWLYLVIAVMLVAALLFTIVATRIRVFEGICDPEKVIGEFGEEPPPDVDFLDDRIVDLAVATNRNSGQNDRIASNLEIASVLIFAAGVSQLVLFLAYLLGNR